MAPGIQPIPPHTTSWASKRLSESVADWHLVAMVQLDGEWQKLESLVEGF